jgi:hypothetical protein
MKNAQILKDRTDRFNSHQGPRVGDFIKMLDGSLQRFAHKWDDGLQTSDGRFGWSFHMFSDGFANFSGGLNPTVQFENIKQTDEVIDGAFWFFSNNEVRAHNGINVKIPCRVFEQV